MILHKKTRKSAITILKRMGYTLDSVGNFTLMCNTLEALEIAEITVDYLMK